MPLDVPGLDTGVTAITASCALTTGGRAKCWGRDLVAVDVPGLSSGVTAIASSSHSCALLGAGVVKCWGLNDHGQLGDGTTTDRSAPVDVAGLHGRATAISVGGFHSCALLSTGAVDCWGANISGQLGDGTAVDRSRPVTVAGFGSAKATLAIVASSVKVTPARVAAIRLRCGSAARCRGTLTVRAGQTLLGARPFSIPAGAAHAVPVKLTRHAVELLVPAKRLSARVDAAGTATASRTITLLAP